MPSETQTEYLLMLDFWFFSLTGKTLEEAASQLEITVDYFVAEFL
jgi:hypothetical protein